MHRRRKKTVLEPVWKIVERGVLRQLLLKINKISERNEERNSPFFAYLNPRSQRVSTEKRFWAAKQHQQRLMNDPAAVVAENARVGGFEWRKIMFVVSSDRFCLQWQLKRWSSSAAIQRLMYVAVSVWRVGVGLHKFSSLSLTCSGSIQTSSLFFHCMIKRERPFQSGRQTQWDDGTLKQQQGDRGTPEGLKDSIVFYHKHFEMLVKCVKCRKTLVQMEEDMTILPLHNYNNVYT